MRRPRPQATDPIFALIEAHKACVVKFEAAIDVEQASLDGTPAEIAAGKRCRSIAERASSRAMRALCETTPTTPEGLVAMLEYLEPLFDETMGEDYADGRVSKLWKTLIKATKSGVAMSAKSPTLSVVRRAA